MPFQKILEELNASSGARGAVMVDEDGEVVAAATGDDGADMELVGAHNAIVLGRIKEACSRLSGCGPVGTVVITSESARTVLSALKDGYCLAVLLPKKAPSGKAVFASKHAAEKIEQEMG